MAENFWGNLPDVEVIVTPAVLMKEQAALLQEMTKGILACEVTRNSGTDTLVEQMRLVAPALGNYRFVLLQVQHGPISYPCSVSDNVSGLGNRTVHNHQEFSKLLAQILGSAEVKRLIGQLLAEIRANSADGTPV